MAASQYSSSSGATAAIYIIMTLASNFGCHVEFPVSLVAIDACSANVAIGEVAYGTVYSCDYVVDNGGELKGAPLRLPGVVSTWCSLCPFPPAPLFRLTWALYSDVIFGPMNIYASMCIYSCIIIFDIYIFIYIHILMNIEVKKEREEENIWTDRPMAMWENR